MIFLGVILGLGIMIAMVTMALSKKSNFTTRVACLGALALMILTVIICLFIALTNTSVPVDESVLIVGAPVETKEISNSNTMVLLLFVILLLVLFVIIAVFALKEHRKNSPKTEIIDSSNPLW